MFVSASPEHTCRQNASIFRLEFEVSSSDIVRLGLMSRNITSADGFFLTKRWNVPNTERVENAGSILTNSIELVFYKMTLNVIFKLYSNTGI